MAKNTSVIFKLQGTIDNITFVDSKRYKKHTRRKRGTVKEATLNTVFEHNKGLISSVNDQAKLIFQPLKLEHHDGSFWSRLIPLFMEEAKAGRTFPLTKLLKLECSTEHTLRALLTVGYAITVKAGRKQLKVTVTLQEHPHWKNDAHILGYELGLVALYPDFKGGTCRKEVAVAPIVSLQSDLVPVAFTLPMPSTQAPYVLLLRIAGSIDRGETCKIPNLNGLAVVAVGG